MKTERESMADKQEYLKYQKEEEESNIKAISQMPKATPEEFMAQYDRLWRPYGNKLQEVANKSVNFNDPPEDKLQQLRNAVAQEFERSQQGRSVELMEVLYELDELMKRPGLTWEDVERKIKRHAFGKGP